MEITEVFVITVAIFHLLRPRLRNTFGNSDPRHLKPPAAQVMGIVLAVPCDTKSSMHVPSIGLKDRAVEAQVEVRQDEGPGNRSREGRGLKGRASASAGAPL